MKAWITRGAVAGAAFCLLATACGSSAKHPTSTATTTSATTASSGTTPLSGTPIPVGNIGSYTSPFNSEIAGEWGVKAWADWTNAHGGIDGHPVKLYVMDDGGVASASLADAKTLIDDDHVVAIIGDESSYDGTWASYVSSAGIPVVGGASDSIPFSTNPDFYPSGAQILTMNYGMLAVAKSEGSKFGFFYCAESPLCEQAQPTIKAMAGLHGVSVPISQSISASAPSYAAECGELKSDGINSYDIASGSAVLEKMSIECKSIGVTAGLVNTDASVIAADFALPGFQGIQVAELDFPFTASSSPATQEFQSAMKQYAPPLGGQMSPFAVYNWVSGQLLAAAIKASGSSSVTAASVKQGLYALPKGDTLGGIAPPLTFTPGQPAVIDCWFVFKIDNNQMMLPQGLTPSCAPPAVMATITKQVFG